MTRKSVKRPADAEPSAPDDGDAAHKRRTLETTGWGLLLVWLGVTTLFAIHWSVFLIGLGMIVLSLQGVRAAWKLGVEGFWIALGGVCVVAGVIEAIDSGLPLVPAALIVFGLATLYGVFNRHRRSRR